MSLLLALIMTSQTHFCHFKARHVIRMFDLTSLIVFGIECADRPVRYKQQLERILFLFHKVRSEIEFKSPWVVERQNQQQVSKFAILQDLNGRFCL